MGDFAVIQPNAMFPTLVVYHTATIAEVDPVHDAAADRTFDVGNSESVFFHGINAVELTPVNGENIGNCCFKQRFQFIRIEEEPQALIAAFDQKPAVDNQIDRPQRDSAAWTDALSFQLMGCVVVNAGKISVIATAAISTLN